MPPRCSSGIRPSPSITTSIPEEAIVSRQRALGDAAQQGYLVGGAHLSFPGLGHVRADQTGFGWAPPPYSVRQTREPAAPAGPPPRFLRLTAWFPSPAPARPRGGPPRRPPARRKVPRFPR